MNAFLIELDNKVGELARITEAISAKGINITAITGATCGGSGSVAVMTADEAGTRYSTAVIWLMNCTGPVSVSVTITAPLRSTRYR